MLLNMYEGSDSFESLCNAFVLWHLVFFDISDLVWRLICYLPSIRVREFDSAAFFFFFFLYVYQ